MTAVNGENVNTKYLKVDHLNLTYEPFPIGHAKNVISQEIYDKLASSFPDISLFKYMPELGKKYSLSEINNHRHFRDFIRSQQNWRDFHNWVKSDAFLLHVFQSLDEAGVPLGFTRQVDPRWANRLKAKIKASNSICDLFKRLRTRFEYSMMTADGGAILPHTDATGKLVTLVVSMCCAGEWDKSIGGSTDVVRPKNPKLYFNRLNNYLTFDEIETVMSFDYEPNQCTLFVKTFNSWHAVSPMNGPKDTMRKTITINIEYK